MEVSGVIASESFAYVGTSFEQDQCFLDAACLYATGAQIVQSFGHVDQDRGIIGNDEFVIYMY